LNLVEQLKVLLSGSEDQGNQSARLRTTVQMAAISKAVPIFL
jgi:hypothetical protein